ncbi:hypothetical protein QBC34DRAFT_379904 [Podospora aff. communis PSN243]|uniref:Uncharacterized protein n=1 Tax=Podospora aff. communis PSN243 TaxID=3040156 RepID=A0AAV9GMZ8_9PEZI|nr:hypothetical protein QBC34DRAFT_379904 [Podospora aff. communis PSN243]
MDGGVYKITLPAAPEISKFSTILSHNNSTTTINVSMFLGNTVVTILALLAHLVATTPLIVRDELDGLLFNPSDVQITPGEGLPSVESLGITMADLHDTVLQQLNTTSENTA